MRVSAKTVAAIGIVLVALAIAYGLITRRGSSGVNPPSPSLNIGGAPREIPSLPAAPIQNKQASVRFILSFSPITVNETLPVYTASEPNITTSWVTVAQKLGFLGLGTSPKDQPTMRWWMNKSGTLKIYARPPGITFTALGEPVGPAAEKEAAEVISAFITNSNVSTGGIGLAPAETQYVTVSGSSYLPARDMTSASMTTVSLKYRLNNIPLYSTSGLPLEALGQVHAGGVIRTATIPIPPVITASSDKQTIPLTLAATHLANNRGVLMNIRSPRLGETSIGEINFSSVNITKASLVYLYMSQAARIIPVYLFEGSVVGGVADSYKAVVTYFVPATYD